MVLLESVLNKSYLKPHGLLTEVTIKRELNDGDLQTIYFDNSPVVLIGSGEIVNLYFPFGKHTIGIKEGSLPVDLVKGQHKILVLKNNQLKPVAF